MAILIGTILGAIFAIFVLRFFWEFVVFKRVMDDPVNGKIASIIAAYLTAAILSGFLRAGDGVFDTQGLYTYFIGAIVVGFFAIRRGFKLRDQLSESEEAAETFD